MLSRIRRLWAISKKDPKQVDKLIEIPQEILEKVPDEGDGKAVFFSEGTEKDFEEFENEQSGMAKWLQRLKDLV